ncbi:single-stranded DNA-binding protein [Candidatus Gracilibacteria bacterium]|nr:MAG: single-stranded DNA-binding protein [Candidatus Gracilibacteria bacterium]
MTNLNKVQLIGRITQEIELKQTPNGQYVTSFSLATNRSWTDENGMKQEVAEFHSIVLWGKLAEIAGQYLGKGRQVYIEGRLQTRNWEAQDGTKRYKTEIIGENLIMFGSKGEEKKNPNQYGKIDESFSDEISIEDIPF